MSDNNKIIYYSLECPKTGNVYIGTKPDRLKDRLESYLPKKRLNYKFECDCGSHIAYSWVNEHKKTIKHQKFVEKIKTELLVVLVP